VKVSTSSEPSSTSSSPDFFRLAVTGEAALLLLAWGLARWLQVTPWAQPGSVIAGIAWGVIAALPLLAALRWMLSTRLAPVRNLVVSVEQQLGPFLVGLSPWQLGALAAIAGISEETLFRGVLQAGLARELSPLGGLLIASGLFGLAHFASRTYAALAGIMGLYLGLLFMIQKTLLAPVLTHALYDLAALLWLVRRVRASPG
jgi:membrane protease YdiL (CAAX protease family)